jgi:hypothetical protein
MDLPATASPVNNTLLPLLELLDKRRAVIADHAWRDRDAASHLSALQKVSEAIMAAHLEMGRTLPPRLQHYLTQCSYDKAAAWIRSGGAES